jgi:hypothetical protein
VESDVATEPLHAFLRFGRKGPLDRVEWPGPHAEGDRWVAGRAARGLRAGDLPWWLDDELWSIEVEGERRPGERAVEVDRARLVARVEAWTPEVAAEFTAACAWRVRDVAVEALRSDGRPDDGARLAACPDLATREREGTEVGRVSVDAAGLLAGFAADVVLYARDGDGAARGAGVGAYIAAHALAGGDKNLSGYAAAFADEREWQVRWLTTRLKL